MSKAVSIVASILLLVAADRIPAYLKRQGLLPVQNPSRLGASISNSVPLASDPVLRPPRSNEDFPLN